MELWDAYTRDEIRTDQILIRGEAIPGGRYHLVCEVLVRHTDGSFLCMLRAKTKSVFPGMYEASAGGSALKGEDPFSCIQRELREETGIKCDAFTEIGISIGEREQVIYHSFVCTVDCDKEKITLQPGETEGFVWLDGKEFRKYLVSDKAIPSQRARYAAYYKENGFL